MEDRTQWLSNKLAETRSQVSKEDWINWLALAPTKMLFLHLEIDLEDHKTNWAMSQYDAGNEFARGQAAYIMELDDILRTYYAEDNIDEEEYNDDES